MPPEDIVYREEWREFRHEIRETLLQVQTSINQILQREHHTPSTCSTTQSVGEAWKRIHALEQDVARAKGMAAVISVLVGMAASVITALVVRAVSGG